MTALGAPFPAPVHLLGYAPCDRLTELRGGEEPQGTWLSTRPRTGPLPFLTEEPSASSGVKHHQFGQQLAGLLTMKVE